MSIYGKYIKESFDNIDINISAEEICRISENCLRNETITENVLDDITVSLKRKLNEITSKLNLSNGAKEKINAKSNTVSNNIVKIVKTDGVNKSSLNKISKEFEEFVDDILDYLKDSDIDDIEFKNYDANKIKNSLLLLFLLLLINVVIILVLTILFGQTVCTIINTCVVAPILEELCKQVAIKGDFIVEFNIVFNVFELTGYVFNIVNADSKIPIINAVKLRLLAVGLHITTSIAQWMASNTKLQEKLKVDKDTSSTIGYLIGVMIHATWNTLAVFSKGFNNKISKIAGL